MKNQSGSYQLVGSDADRESNNVNAENQNGAEVKEEEEEETWLENGDLGALRKRKSTSESIDFSENHSKRVCYYLRLRQNWIPDVPVTFSTTCGANTSDGQPEGEEGVTAHHQPMVILDLFLVKFLKFMLMTIGLVLISHFLVKTSWLEWEKDPQHTIANLILYDGNLIAMDMFVFFCVARLHRERGVDNLAFLIPAVSCCSK